LVEGLESPLIQEIKPDWSTAGEIEMLEVQVTFFVEGGKKKAKVTAMFYPDGEVLSVDPIMTSSACTVYLGWLIWIGDSVEFDIISTTKSISSWLMVCPIPE